MNRRMKFLKSLIVGCLLLQGLSIRPAYSQGTLADYYRAESLRTRLNGLAINVPDRPGWIGTTSRFWYRKSVAGGNEFVLVDAESLTRSPAFDHERLAKSLSAAT